MTQAILAHLQQTAGEKIELIECDLGASAVPGAQQREGFKQLLASIAMGVYPVTDGQEFSATNGKHSGRCAYCPPWQLDSGNPCWNDGWTE